MAKTILSSDKIHTLHHTFYEPRNDAKATLLIVHGMTEHSGRYHQFAEFLTEHDIAVLTYDQLGHGRTISNAEELGYFSKSHPMQKLLKDVVIMADQLKAKYPDVPHFIMGHSMGSFVVRNVLQVHSDQFEGAIIMGSSDYNPLLKPMMPVMEILNKVQPKRHNSVISSAMNIMFNAQLKDKKMDSDHAWLCNNPEAIADYEKDPLCGFDFTNNGYWTLLKLMQGGLAKDWAETIEHDFPMLFMSGKNDPVGYMGKAIPKATKRLKKQGFKHVEKQLYPSMRHEPLHEVENKKVYQDLLNWIEGQLEKSA